MMESPNQQTKREQHKEILRLHSRITQLKAALSDIAKFTFCKPGFLCNRCNETRRKALTALKEQGE